MADKPKAALQWPERVGYITATTRPLNCLVFLLPIIVLHQVGILHFTADLPVEQYPINAAFGILREILSLFGSRGLYLPGMTVVATLLIWHLARAYPWRVRARQKVPKRVKPTAAWARKPARARSWTMRPAHARGVPATRRRPPASSQKTPGS